MVLTFALSDPSARSASFSYSTLDGTALSSKDYMAASGIVTFLPGEIIQTVEISLIDDAIDEEREAFTVALTDANNLVLDATSLQVFIDDNDDAYTTY